MGGTVIRRMISFVFGSALFLGGGYLLLLQIRCASGLAEGTCKYGGKIGWLAVMPMALGGWLLWQTVFGKWTARGLE
jgi:hypothetical protein